MCDLDILHDSFYQLCPKLHLKRLNSLTLGGGFSLEGNS